MTLRLLALVHDAHDPARVAKFWAALLERTPLEGDWGWLLPGSPAQVGLAFQPSDSVKVATSAVHLHLTSDAGGDQQAVVDRALALGASHRDVGQLPEEGHVVLADPEGNEFCVIEPGNDYLRGCGPLGELACDGLRHTGVFWSQALGWPLVWDQDGETAIQSPAGGTKVAWGGPPLDPKHGRDRQRFAVVGDQDELSRLLSLGATRLAEPGRDAGREPGAAWSSQGAAEGATGWAPVELADPDGHEFVLLPG